MEEQKETQVEQEEETSQPEVTTESQPTVTELQGKLEERDAEISRKEEVIQQTKKELKNVIRRGGSKAEVDALDKKIDTMQTWFAGAMDDLITRTSGEEEVRPARKSYTEQLEATRVTKQADPAAQRFFDYLGEEGLDFDDEDVQETIKDTKTPQEALKAVKDKVKTMNQSEIEKLADQKAEGKMQIAIEKALKEKGLTATGAGTPSGATSSFEKLEENYADGKVSYADYKKARTEQGLS